MLETIEFSFKQYFTLELLIDEILCFFDKKVKAVSYNDFWDTLEANNDTDSIIGLDMQDTRGEYHDTLVTAEVNFNLQKMRNFYHYISKKYHTEVIFSGCDNLTKGYYCLYDKNQRLFYGEMLPSNDKNQDFEIFVINGEFTNTN